MTDQQSSLVRAVNDRKIFVVDRTQLDYAQTIREDSRILAMIHDRDDDTLCLMQTLRCRFTGQYYVPGDQAYWSSVDTPDSWQGNVLPVDCLYRDFLAWAEDGGPECLDEDDIFERYADQLLKQLNRL